MKKIISILLAAAFIVSHAAQVRIRRSPPGLTSESRIFILRERRSFWHRRHTRSRLRTLTKANISDRTVFLIRKNGSAIRRPITPRTPPDARLWPPMTADLRSISKRLFPDFSPEMTRKTRYAPR